MTIQTPIADPTQDQLDALAHRSEALMRTHRDLHDTFVAALRSAEDPDAMFAAQTAISGAMLRLDVNDHDLIDRLRDQLHGPEGFGLIRIAHDVKRRSEDVDIMIDKIRTRRSAAIRRAQVAAEAPKKRSAYTTTYESAMRLTARQRRQLAEALLS